MEVSQRHQNHKFCIKIGPDIQAHPLFSDVGEEREPKGSEERKGTTRNVEGKRDLHWPLAEAGSVCVHLYVPFVLFLPLMDPFLLHLHMPLHCPSVVA